EIWPGPLPNVMFKGGLAPIVIDSVLPPRPWVRRLVGLVTPAVMPSSDRSPAEVPVVSSVVLALAPVRTIWWLALSDADTFVVPDWRLTALTIVCALAPGAIAIGVPLITRFPPAELRPETSASPTTVAGASGDSVAPLPIMRAGAVLAAGMTRRPSPLAPRAAWLRSVMTCLRPACVGVPLGIVALGGAEAWAAAAAGAMQRAAG